MSASKSLSAISINRQMGLSVGQAQEGVNIRNPSTALLGVSSIDRYNLPGGEASELVAGETNPLSTQTLSSPFDFNICSNNTFLSGFFTRLAVNEIQFRWTIPTITSRNNKIYLVWSPAGNTNITAVQVVGSVTTFTMASTAGYTGGQTIVVGGLQYASTPAGTQNINGVYTIASTTGTTLVCNNPNSLVAFATTALAGVVGIRYTNSIAEGWYDLTQTAVTGGGAQGNLAYQLQADVRAVTGSTTFTCFYNFNSGANPQPYNCFGALSGNTDKFYFYRVTDASQPNRVSLFEMMSWATNQTPATVQTGNPNASLLSTPFVDIVCNNLTYNQSLKDADTGTSRNILCRLWLTPDAFTGNMANLGSAPILVHRAFPFPKQVKWNADQPIGNLRFQVYDSQGYLLSTNDGLTGLSQSAYYDADMGDWTMTLLVSEV